MSSPRITAAALIFACAFAVVLAGYMSALAPPAAARDDDKWKVHEKLLGKLKDDGRDRKKSQDVSGIACATTLGFPRTCLLVDDQTQGAQIVILREKSLVAGTFIPLIDGTLDGYPVDLDGEGVAYAGGAFYVTGSHGRPRHEKEALKKAEDTRKAKAQADAQTKASAQVIRVRFDLSAVDDRGKLFGRPEIKVSTALSAFINKQSELEHLFNKPLDENGLTVEGVAVRGEQMYFGMRGPILANNDAAILSVPLAALFEGQNGAGRLHRLNLEKRRGVRDLVEFEKGFLLIAGPVNDPKDDKVEGGDYSVVWWDGENQTKRLGDLEGYGKKVKPEALVPIDRKNDKLHVLLFFDGPDEGAPRLVKVDAPPHADR